MAALPGFSTLSAVPSAPVAPGAFDTDADLNARAQRSAAMAAAKLTAEVVRVESLSFSRWIVLTVPPHLARALPPAAL